MGRSFLGLSKKEFWDMSPRTLISMITSWKEIKYGKKEEGTKKARLKKGLDVWDSL